MGNTKDTGFLRNLISYDSSGNVVLPANVTVTGSLLTSGGATYATQSYVTTQISNLVNAAPGALDTLKELATALGNDANFATTVATSIGTKQAQLNGTGFVKISGTTISYDNSTYLTSASLTGYIPYTGATGNVTLGNYELGAKYVIAEGSAGLGGVISIKQDAAYLAKGNGYSSIASSFTEFDFFGYTGASTYKNFTLKFDGLTNNTRRRYTLPDSDGTLALTSNLSSYLPLAGGTLTGALGGTSATFSSTVNAQGGLLLTTSQTANTAGSIGYNSTVGTFIYSKAGSSFDFRLYNGVGVTVMSIPTATQSAIFSSSVALDGGDFRYRPNGDATNSPALVLKSPTAGVLSLCAEVIGDANANSNSLSLRVSNPTNGRFDALTIASTGAATFSSSVSASFLTTKSSSGAAALLMQDTSGVNKWEIGHQSGALYMYNYTTDNSSVYITSAGNVGIGATSITNHKLQITGSIANVFLQSSVDGSAIDYGSYGISSSYPQVRLTMVDDGNWGGHFFISTKPGGASTNALVERVRVTSGGNMGVGVTSPSWKLSVANEMVVGAQGGSDYTYISGGSGYGSVIRNYYATGTINNEFRGNGNNYVNLGYGSFGIGTSNPLAKLHVNGGKLIHTSDDGSYGQFQINASTTSTEATILLSNGGSGVNNGQYTNVGVIGMGSYGAGRDTLVLGTGYNGWTMGMKNGTTTFTGNVVNSASYKANTFVQLTTIATKTFSVSGQTSGSFAVTDFSGVPSNAKAVAVYGWYHITGYSAGAGQGDHAVCWYGLANDTSVISWSGPGGPWPGSGAFTNQYYGSFSMEHDGDASGANMTNFMHYYGSWHNGIINVNANGSIYYTLGFGYSGGTHHNALYCTGYWI